MSFPASVILLAHLIASFLVLGGYAGSKIIHISDGPVIGMEYERTSEFYNIRYGEPPIGNLRFKPPVPTRSWNNPDTLNSEDPLYKLKENGQFSAWTKLVLNIFTPTGYAHGSQTSVKSVLVHFSDAPIGYRAEEVIALLMMGDIIYVHADYRSGVFGFLNMDHPNATGNQGLKDQVLALKWVQKNIHHFGGNPNAVTIMGIGAAAALVGYHVLSNSSAGLFHRAISMGGTPLGPNSFVPLAKAVHRGEALARIIIGYDKNTPFTCQSAMTILDAATTEELTQASLLLNKEFGPTLEDPSIAKDPFLTECITSIYESGTFNKVPQIIGFKKLNVDSSVDHVKKIRIAMTEATKCNDSWSSDLNSIPDDWLTIDLQSDLNAVSEIITSDRIKHTVQLLSAKNGDNPIFYYETVLVPMLQGTYPYQVMDVMRWRESEIGSTALTPLKIYNRKVQVMWTNFVKYGDPSRSGFYTDLYKIGWPDVSGTGIGYQISDEDYDAVKFEGSRFSLPNVCDVQ